MRKKNEQPFGSEWNTALNGALKRYRDHTGPDTYAEILFLIMQGIKDDVTAEFPAGLYDEGKEFPTFRTVAAKFGESLFYGMQTVPEESFKMSVGLKLRKMLEKVVADDEVRGLVINPLGTDCCFLPKSLIEQMLVLYFSEVPDDSPDHCRELGEMDPERTEYKLSLKLPMSPAQYRGAKAIVASFEDTECFCIEFKELFDSTLFIQTEREGDAYHTEICFDMSEFGQKPLVLRSDAMPADEVNSFIEKLCVKMISSDDIPCIMHWKSKY